MSHSTQGNMHQIRNGCMTLSPQTKHVLRAPLGTSPMQSLTYLDIPPNPPLHGDMPVRQDNTSIKNILYLLSPLNNTPVPQHTTTSRYGRHKALAGVACGLQREHETQRYSFESWPLHIKRRRRFFWKLLNHSHQMPSASPQVGLPATPVDFF